MEEGTVVRSPIEKRSVFGKLNHDSGNLNDSTTHGHDGADTQQICPNFNSIKKRVTCRYCTQTAISSPRIPGMVTRWLSTSHCAQAGGKWRESQGQSRSGRDYGPLVDLPDWTYADGRPAPLGSGQYKRQEEQKQIAERIDRLSSEMMAAVQKEKEALIAKQRKQQEIDQHKLKPKGQYLRKKKKVQAKGPI